MDIKINNLNYLHLSWVVLALLVVVIYGFARKRQALERFASANLLGYLTPRTSLARQWIKAVLLLLAMVALVFGAIDLRWGIYWDQVPRRGIDIIFALDVSRSMMAEDLKPNRLERAKQYINDMLEAVVGDRVGLVTFAGNAVMKCPLTINFGSFHMVLDEVGIRSSSRGGSLIGDAVRIAADSFVDQVKKYKAVIVITDGEDHESYPVEAAQKAFEEKGIRIYTIGLGDAGEGARIPTEKDGAKIYVQHDGQEVWSKMDEKTLLKMAEVGGGAYIPAGTKNIDLAQIYREKIAAVEQREFEAASIRRYKVKFQWFAGLALVLLIMETWMTDRRSAVPKEIVT